jgi:hypothetical protein
MRSKLSFADWLAIRTTTGPAYSLIFKIILTSSIKKDRLKIFYDCVEAIKDSLVTSMIKGNFFLMIAANSYPANSLFSEEANNLWFITLKKKIFIV